MLHLIAEAVLGRCPAPWHRLALRWAHQIRIRWWQWRRPNLIACRILAFDPQGQVLLVRHSYGSSKWMPPGGGMKQGEEALVAASRELREEVGCKLEQARLIAVMTDRFHGAGNQVHIVAGLCQGSPQPDRREIVEASFFAPDALPADTIDLVLAQMPHWLAAMRDSRCAGS